MKKIPQSKKKDAIKIFNKWIESVNDVPDLLKSRYRELKEIGRNLVERHGEHKKKLSGDSLVLVNNGKIGRNSPCPCGSGKKFKKCCGMP